MLLEKLKTVFSYLMLFLIMSVHNHVLAEEKGSDINWVLLGESANLDRSSKYLYRGKQEKGIRYAHKALDLKLTEVEHLIAQHNLCIAYRAQGELEQAALHCRQSQGATPRGHTLKKLRPGLYRVTAHRSSDTGQLQLSVVLAGNLQASDPREKLAASDKE